MGKPVKKPETWWGISVFRANKQFPAQIIPVDKVVITAKKLTVHYHQRIHGKPVFPEKIELDMDDIVSIVVGRV